MSFDRFIRVSDSLFEFEASLTDKQTPMSSIHSIEIHREELKTIWGKLKLLYEKCLSDLDIESDKDEKGKAKQESNTVETVKSKYKSAYVSYCRCGTRLGEFAQELSIPKVETNASQHQGFKLPPCDIATFGGDYSTWPTFRDMFTAVCIMNPRLSPIEKLFHLNQKTKGEPNDIVGKIPLTNDNFTLAWQSLCSRYENKRVLVNVQLKSLFNLQSITIESAAALKNLQREINASISMLRLYEIDVDSWDSIFIFVCSNRLPENTLTLWEQTLSNKALIPKWSELDSFLTNRHRTLESVSEIRKPADNHSFKSSGGNKSNNKGNTNNVRSFQNNVTESCCRLCPKESHTIRKCPLFLKMNHNQRLAEIKKSNLCLNCFSRTHTVKNCASKHSCYQCHKRHNTLLHRDHEGSTSDKPSTNSTTTPKASTSVTTQSTNNQGHGLIQTCFSTNSRSVLLGTTLVKINQSGVTYCARALLDSGSEGTFISENLFHMLKLPFRRTFAKISGLNNTISADVQKECSFIIGSNTNPSIEIPVSALVVPHLSGSLPSRHIDPVYISDLPDIPLADPHFYESSKIDILLGGDLLPSIMLSGIKNQICGSLMAQETVFGWVLTGPLPLQSIPNFSTFVSYFCEISLDKQISRFWEVEDLPRKKLMSTSDQFCEDLYVRTTKRDKNGRYIVSLPFKEGFLEKMNIGHSRSIAMAQYFRNEARLLRSPEFKLEYDRVLQEYTSLGHMSNIPFPLKGDSLKSYYLPHHAVIKPESTTTRVRVVFNASAVTSDGKSLNDVLHTGPILQNDLTILILKWRLFRYVFNGDISKMYRQILVNPDHTQFQRILFRQTPTDPIRDYELKTVTFGVNCAPYLAIRTIMQLADDVQRSYPLASDILRNSMYVDDALVGAHSIPAAIEARNQLVLALESAGFTMRKWTSNSKTIIDDIPTEHRLYEDFLEFEDCSTAKTLGIRWNAHSDSFLFSVEPFPESCKYTKREVLSQISKLFDPAGWLAPCIIVSKIIMQRIWVEGTGWDEVISTESLAQWKSFQTSYQFLQYTQIPRWFGYTRKSHVQFHGFSDASEKAYAAALYILVSDENSISTQLVSAKTRVAPIKTLSIPRLELCGAVLLSEMIDAIVPQMGIENYSIHCWTDSTIVLSWLSKPPCVWTTFVANRVSQIIQVTNPSYWHHVISESNPADLASRGIPMQDLPGNELWWHGPYWLREPQSAWPKSNQTCSDDLEIERKPVRVHFSYFSNFEDILDRFSSLPRAFRVIAYMYRFYYSTHPKHRSNYARDSTTIYASEIKSVHNQLISTAQKAYYPNEYMVLSAKKPIASTSCILSLNPFLDSEGIMRISGRLELTSHLTYNEKHAIIMPYNCQYSRLLVRFIHQLSLHGGNQLVLRLVRTKYWIPKVKNLIKATINRCKPCILYKQKCQRQLMSALPPERTEFSRPFSHTGIDFAGPFDIKTYLGRACRITKGYVCIFVCFSTKAIHLEATSDLSTPSFLGAFTRFVSRRGCPSHLHSDNGTNFVGASKVLAKEFLQNSQQAVTSNYALQNISWHFIPPGAPHMGGLWEAGVKSFKTHFRKVANNFKYTFEEFQTLLSKIEACLNSRPLSPISQEPTDFTALTPGHFLIGSPLLVPIDPTIHESPMSIVNRWQRLKVIHQQFCNRWKNEYLTELHKRYKWQTATDNLTENMLVVIKDENLPPNSWRLGRISKVYFGADERVRVADIITEKGTIKRPITKLIVLPFESATS